MCECHGRRDLPPFVEQYSRNGHLKFGRHYSSLRIKQALLIPTYFYGKKHTLRKSTSIITGPSQCKRIDVPETAAVARQWAKPITQKIKPLCSVTVSPGVEFFGKHIRLGQGACRQLEHNGPSVTHQNQRQLAQYGLNGHHIDWIIRLEEPLDRASTLQANLAWAALERDQAIAPQAAQIYTKYSNLHQVLKSACITQIYTYYSNLHVLLNSTHITQIYTNYSNLHVLYKSTCIITMTALQQLTWATKDRSRLPAGTEWFVACTKEWASAGL